METFDLVLRIAGLLAGGTSAVLGFIYFRRQAIDAAQARTMSVQAMTIAAQSDLVSTLKEQANAVQGEMRKVELLSESHHRNLAECERARSADKAALETWDRFYGSIQLAQLWLNDEGADASDPSISGKPDGPALDS